MAGYKRNQDSFQASNSNDNENNSIATSSSEAQPTKRQHSENNDKESICWKYFEPFKAPKENGTITKCTIPGCTTRYMWCGSTSNLVGHLKTKHGITKSSTPLPSTTSTISSINSEPEINLPLIKFIVSSGAHFSVVDNLKSAGFISPEIDLSTSNIIKEQIDKVYNRLFLQLKLKVQQEKSTVLSIHSTKDTRFTIPYTVITCNWLTKDFELHKILLLAKECNYYRNIIEALEKWELTNLKFYSCYDDYFLKYLYKLKEENYQNLVQLHENTDNYVINLYYSILKILGKWARENVNIQGMYKTIIAINYATENLGDIIYFLKWNITSIQQEIQNMQITFDYSTIIGIQNANKISCGVKSSSFHGCIYHQIAFLKLVEIPFILLVNNYDSFKCSNIREKGKLFKELELDSLPFSIFTELLQLFKPLEHACKNYHKISTEEYIGLVDKFVINANNMSRELQFSDNQEHKILKSFLISVPLYFECNDLFAEQLALFLDPNSKPGEVSTAAINCALKKCQAYYFENIFSGNLDKSLQAANKELKCYINRPQSSLDDDINPYEWWKGSKQMLPGLAALAREYLPALTVDKEDIVKNLDKFMKIYDDEDMADKTAFLQYNMKYIDLYL
ncbi:10518_t:CDS:2 [Dentiscutata heterogama]|uniref:10518_t:CDS:1 n=1 Tax=Dentiscutata heterogama TaxID=1316150 RepID=A0ACA9MUM5_9GLOM|nr:10518_t:CDS:2 [Dentiscutata heterogama]